MMDVVDFELCLDVDKYRKKPQPKLGNPPEEDKKAEDETTSLLNNAPPKSPLVRKYAQFVEDEYSTVSRKKENNNGNNDAGSWLSLPPKRPRLSPYSGLGVGNSASTGAVHHGIVGSTGDQGRGQGARAGTGTGTDAGVDDDGDTMMDVDTTSMSNLPTTTTSTAPATATPPTPTPCHMQARPSRPPPSASTQFAIYEDPDTMDVDEANVLSTPLHSPIYSTASVGHTTNNNNTHYIHPYVSSQTDEDKENTENENENEDAEGEQDSNIGETHSSQQNTLSSFTEGDQRGYYHGEHRHHLYHHRQGEGENEDQESQADDEADDGIYSRNSATTSFTNPSSRRIPMPRRRRPHQYYTYHADRYLGQRSGYEYEYDFVESSSDTRANADISTSVRGFVGGEPSWNHSPGSSSTITTWGREGRGRGDTTTTDSVGGITDGSDPVDIRQEMLSSAAVPGDYHRSRGGLRRVHPGGASGGRV